MSSYSSPVHFSMIGLRRVRGCQPQIILINKILLDVFVTKLFFGDPVISLYVDDVEGLVKLKSCPQGLEKQSELSELQIIITILAVTL